MPPPKLKRHVLFSQIGDGWCQHGIDAGHTPDAVLTWIEESLSGRWSFRSLTDAEVVEQTGKPAGGKFFLLVAFEDPDDYSKFKLRVSKPEGRA
jgi:hypothetical protein